MKRLALALLLIPSLALSAPTGKLMIVYDHNTIQQPLYSVADQAAYDTENGRVWEALRNMLTMTGVNYTVVPSPATKTLFCGTGNQVWDYGLSDARVEHFDAVIHLNYIGTSGNLHDLNSTTYRPESLLISGKTPTVPQLLLLDGGSALMNASTVVQSGNFKSGCTGITSNASTPLIATSSGKFRWFGSANTSKFTIAAIPFGVRGLLTTLDSRFYSSWDQPSPYDYVNTGVMCAWCDSITFQNPAADSVAMWEIPFTSVAGAAPLVFCNYFGSSDCGDSTGQVGNACEGDPVMLLYALAHLDSLTGGKLFDKSKLPIKASIIIRGAFDRGLEFPDTTNFNAVVTPTGGVLQADTTSLKATLDSLAALPQPMRLSVVADLDSVPGRLSEIGWWNKLPYVHFIASSRRGIDSTMAYGCSPTAISKAHCNSGVPSSAAWYAGNWLWAQPVDVFGRYRQRAFLGTDSTFISSGTGGIIVNDADSSICNGVRSLFFRADSIFGKTRTSRFLVAPLDDWSPINMRWTANALDSLIYVLRHAGAVGVLSDAQRPEADPNRMKASPDLVRGWIPRQGYYVSKYGGGPLKVLTHTGYSIIAGGDLYMNRPLSDGSYQPNPPFGGGTGGGNGTVVGLPFYELNRFWSGMFHNNYRDVDYWPTDVQHDKYDDVIAPKADKFNNIMHSNVYVVDANTLGGKQPRPARGGYWVIKSIWSAMNAINDAAQRTVITLDYPENVAP